MDKLFYSDRRTTSKTRQKKKHRNQMTSMELIHCTHLLKYSLLINDKFELTSHFKEKRRAHVNLGILKGMVLNDSFPLDNIVEYNETICHGNTYKRVLIRHPEIITIDREVCYQYLVMEIQTGKIVTMYYNSIYDNHSSLDLSYYDETLEVIKN